MSRAEWSQTIKPFNAEHEPSDTNKAMARNRMRGDWLAASTGDVSMVEVASIDVHEDGSATILYRMASAS